MGNLLRIALAFALLFLTLLASGCGAPAQRSGPAPRHIDTQCMQDCMGVQAGREFCEDRCSF
jgi:hypothetical protein